MSEKLYLKPGRTIGKKGLPKGKLECKASSEPLELTAVQLKVLEKNLPYLKIKGIVLTASQVAELAEKEETPASSGKSDARIALEKEATEFGIKFTDRTSGKDLKAEIELKKSESTELEDLKTMATELEIEFEDDVTVEDLKLLIEAKE